MKKKILLSTSILLVSVPIVSIFTTHCSTQYTPTYIAHRGAPGKNGTNPQSDMDFENSHQAFVDAGRISKF
jgi:glycerophosphoryl diester phosphodiesterase